LETDRRRDTIDCITLPTKAVGNDNLSLIFIYRNK